MKIGIIGDPHATVAPLQEALDIFAREQVADIWCTGDIAGYGEQLDETIELLAASHCKAVRGNHDVWYVEQQCAAASSPACRFLSALPAALETVLAGYQLYMVHASPPLSLMDGIRLLDQDGQLLPEQQSCWSKTLASYGYDVIIVGHTHQLYAEMLGKTLLINPGSTCFNHACAILHLPELHVQWFGLSNQPPRKTWNWGLYYADSGSGPAQA